MSRKATDFESSVTIFRYLESSREILNHFILDNVGSVQCGMISTAVELLSKKSTIPRLAAVKTYRLR